MQKLSRGQTELQFYLKSKISLEHSRWPQTQSPIQVRTKRCDGRPTGSTLVHIIAISQCIPTPAIIRSWLSLIGAYLNYVLCKLVSHANQYWVDQRLLTSVTFLVVITWYIMTSHEFLKSRDDYCWECLWRDVTKNSQLVMIDSWNICNTGNVSKEDGLMTTTFLKSWIWFTCISLMVRICDKKRRLTLYIWDIFITPSYP